jgi:DNA-3-methyladenine glycosylase
LWEFIAQNFDLAGKCRLARCDFARQMGFMPRLIMPRELRTRNTVALARWLLGKALVRTEKTGRSSHVITEVEAYNGERDLASHASKGRTKRTEVMYQAGGIWYVYLCYGVHEMLNLVTGPVDFPTAVLIRGVHDISGPGRLTKRLGIGRQLNGLAAHPRSGLHLEDIGLAVTNQQITSGPRIGVDYAGPVWAGKPWRFCLDTTDLPLGAVD